MIVEFTQRAKKFIPKDDRFNRREYEVAPIPELVAKDFVIKWHYAGSFPSARRKFGLFWFGRLVGVAVFSHPQHNATITNTLDCSATDAMELGRFVLLDEVPFNAESWFFTRCKELLKREGIAGIVSFADDFPRTDLQGNIVFKGHLGIAYAGAGGLYVGRGAKSRTFLFADGADFSPRAMSKVRKDDTGADYVCRQLAKYAQTPMPTETEARKLWFERELKLNTRRFSTQGKHKYVWQLDKSVRVKKEILPYPKISHKLIQPLLA